MPAATKKADLIDVTRKEFEKLSKTLELVEPAQAMRKREDDTSIKDVIAHRAHWIRLFLGWYSEGMAGRPVDFPAKGFRWNDLTAYNATLRDRQADMGWADARALLIARHASLMAFVNDHSDADLYGGPMKGASNTWTAGRWAEAAGASHYRSASKWIRSCLRADLKGDN